MVEAEKILTQAIEQVPALINDLPSCVNGTTEQLCHYFLNTIKFRDREIKIISVSVSETANRITMFKIEQKNLAARWLLIAYYLLPITYYLWTA